MKTLSLVMATLLTSSVAAGAHTNRAIEERSQEVSFADLDLSRDQGAEQLYRRIRAAAREVCWTAGVSAVFMRPKMRRCANEAVARAIADVNAPLLTRYHVALVTAAASADAPHSVFARSDEKRGPLGKFE